VVGVGEGKVDMDLGRIWAELGLGPKTKVVARTMLYISYLGVIVIRVIN
jgi:hypothetical protein